MVADAADNELVGTYARDGSETAFRALVSRHVDLVFGVALRQTGEAGAAEEITQNVFIALARKAPRLAAHETLAGWLHRTAILESKARLRADLRRQRREEAAAVLSELQREGRGPSEDLTPLLDEGLLHLREPDRVALILRYLEARSLREVGRALGVEEDAARKRVDRALERLAGFFRTRGFAVPAGTGAAVLTQASAASASPATLAWTTGSAGLAAGGAGGTGILSSSLLSLMNLSNLQTTVVCALLIAVPLAWQWNQHRELRAEEDRVLAARSVATSELEDAEARLRRKMQEIAELRAEVSRVLAGRAAASSAARGRDVDRYRWDDGSPYVRFPKELLRQISVPATTDRRGELTPQIRAALQMTDAEAGAVQDSLNRFLAAVQSAQSATLKSVPPSPQELAGHSPGDVRVFEISGVQEVVSGLRKTLASELEATLGGERNELFLRALRSWIPMEEEGGRGINGAWAFLPADHRLQFFNDSGESEGHVWLRCGATLADGTAFFSAIRVEEIPEYLRPHLQDWVDGAQAARRTAAAPDSQP